MKRCFTCFVYMFAMNLRDCDRFKKKLIICLIFYGNFVANRAVENNGCSGNSAAPSSLSTYFCDLLKSLLLGSSLLVPWKWTWAQPMSKLFCLCTCGVSSSLLSLFRSHVNSRIHYAHFVLKGWSHYCPTIRFMLKRALRLWASGPFRSFLKATLIEITFNLVGLFSLFCNTLSYLSLLSFWSAIRLPNLVLTCSGSLMSCLFWCVRARTTSSFMLFL